MKLSLSIHSQKKNKKNFEAQICIFPQLDIVAGYSSNEDHSKYLESYNEWIYEGIKVESETETETETGTETETETETDSIKE